METEGLKFCIVNCLWQREKKKPVIAKEYFNYMNLEGIVATYPYRKNLCEEEIIKGLYAV